MKYKDIPEQVAGAAKMVAKYGQNRILGFTVHCLGGRKALREAVKAVKDIYGNDPSAPLVMAVTLLTTLNEDDLKEFGIRGISQEVVARLARIASEEGVPAIVCSGHEASLVMEVSNNFKVVTPGIRFPKSDPKSQKRIVTPGQAVLNGAWMIVMGTDLREAEPETNIRRAAMEIVEAEDKLTEQSDK